MWCWFGECELYVSLGEGGLLGFASLLQGALGAYRAVLVPARCLRLRLVVPTPEAAQTPSKPPDGHPRARAPPQALLLLLRQTTQQQLHSPDSHIIISTGKKNK